MTKTPMIGGGIKLAAHLSSTGQTKESFSAETGIHRETLRRYMTTGQCPLVSANAMAYITQEAVPVDAWEIVPR